MKTTKLWGIEAEAILFDLDGVLIDSESMYTVFWNGIEHTYPTGIPDYAHYIKGTNLNKILSNYPSEQVREDIKSRLHAFEETMEYPLYPGARELLERLKAEGIPTAIVTSSDAVKMSHLYRRHPWLPDTVTAIITGSMVTHSKPHPEGYLLGAQAVGRDIAQCIVVEDSIQGLQAGRASGAKVVGIATTNAAERLIPLADVVVSSL